MAPAVHVCVRKLLCMPLLQKFLRIQAYRKKYVCEIEPMNEKEEEEEGNDGKNCIISLSAVAIIKLTKTN